MNRRLRRMREDRAARDRARATYEAHLALIKADLEDRGIAGRIADEAAEQARAMVDEAIDVAETHPGAVAGTIAALGLWLLRNPLLAWLGEYFEPVRKLREDIAS